MGRSAKYQTREERLGARRAQRAERATAPGAREARQAENRRAWQKKRWLQLLDREPPKIPQAIREEAEKAISSDKYPRIFNQFLEGRDSLGLDEVDVEEIDFEAMTGAPPYPNHITSLSGFSEVWPMLGTALHGIMARQYLKYCDELIARCSGLTEDHIMAGLDVKYRELTVEFNREVIKIRRLAEEGDRAAVAIATQNNRWIARLVLYTAQDMALLREGSDKLVHGITERKWTVGHRRHEAFGLEE